MMARIPYFGFNQASPALAKIMDGRRPLNMHGLIGHADESAVSFLALGRSLLTASALEPELRELVILRTATLCGAGYEVAQHRKASARIGLAPAKVDAVTASAKGQVPFTPFSASELAVLNFTDGVVRDVKAAEPLFDAAAAVLTQRQLVELLMLIGFYLTASRIGENLEVDLEQG